MKSKLSYRLKGESVFIGLEDSKRTWKLCVRSGGHEVHNVSMPAEYQSLQSYLQGNYPDCKITVLYEAGFRGFTLYDQLIADSLSCVVIAPHLVTEEKSNQVKTDKRDAKRLAKILETHDYKHKCYVPDKEQREDRQVSRTLGQIQRKITSTKNQIRRAFEYHGLDEGWPAGIWPEKLYRESEQKISTIEISSSLKFSLSSLYSILNLLLEQRKMLRQELLNIGEKERYKHQVEILMSAPGIGKATAIRLLLEWGDVTRFQNGKEFSAYTGMTPREYSTGDSIRKGHITGQGNSFARAWLVESAWTAVRKDPALNKKYMDIIKRTRSKKIAIVAVARKLAVRLRAILVEDKMYELSILK